VVAMRSRGPHTFARPAATTRLCAEAQADDKGFLEQPAIIARAFPMSRLSAGTKLGSCEVIELLGAGGMDI